MVPCCKRSEIHYLMPATKMPSRAWVDKTFGEEATISIVDDNKTTWGELVFKRHGWYPKLTLIKHGDGTEQLCMCPCHVIGSMVMH
jgi:hypothetical protein